MTEKSRRYRLAREDRTGWIFGLSGSQCLGLGAGVLLSGTALNSGAHLLVALLPVLVTALLVLGRWNDAPIYDRLLVHGRWVLLEALNLRNWSAPIGEPDALPPFLQGYELRDIAAPEWIARLDDGGVGVVIDESDATVSATVPVRARAFSLREEGEQDRILSGWGDALSALCTERRTIRRVIWQERASTATAAPAYKSPAGSSPLTHAYDDLVTERRRQAVAHESSITVVVDLRRTGDAEAGVAVLLDELRMLTQRLGESGFDVDVPLSAHELAHAVAVRLDPEPGEYSTARTLADLIGTATSRSVPRSALLDWNWIRTGSSVHHSYVVTDWPRTDLRADWLEPMVFGGTGTRTLTIVAEPVALSVSRRQVNSDATKLSTDESQRDRAGFRIDADHRRLTEAVAEREEELASGFVEFTYVGLVTVTAGKATSLRNDCLDCEQVAAHCGIALASLGARHDVGLVYSLPLGRGPSLRKFS